MGISFVCAGDCGAAIANASKAGVKIGIICISGYRGARGPAFPLRKTGAITLIPAKVAQFCFRSESATFLAAGVCIGQERRDREAA
jgi:hypothetical protein